MKILGAEPDEQLLNYVRAWIKQYNTGEVEALIFDQRRSCMMVGTIKGPHKWVVFWNPRTTVDKAFHPTHWYVWDVLPQSRKSSMLRCYKEHRSKFNTAVLKNEKPWNN